MPYYLNEKNGFKWMVRFFPQRGRWYILSSWRLEEVGFLEPFELWEGKTWKRPVESTFSWAVGWEEFPELLLWPLMWVSVTEPVHQEACWIYLQGKTDWNASLWLFNLASVFIMPRLRWTCLVSFEAKKCCKSYYRKYLNSFCAYPAWHFNTVCKIITVLIITGCSKASLVLPLYLAVKGRYVYMKVLKLCFI